MSVNERRATSLAEREDTRWRVDCRSMPAPYPLLGARAAIALMKEGETLYLLATDPEAPVDLPAWCRMTGNCFLNQREWRGVYCFLIRKGPSKEL
jgi:TusA-related sulfurtransferase